MLSHLAPSPPSRIACVDVPAFPLQLLAQREPTWREFPMAVVDHDKPQGVIQWVNERARTMRILPGMRYAAGLSLARDLRAAVVDEADVATHIDDLCRRLRFFTPDVEASSREPGVFWLNAAGLSLLFPELTKWAALIHDEIERAGFISSTIVGHSRFGVYAAAKGMTGVRGTGARARTRVLADIDDERDWVRRVPIARLAFDPALRDTLAKLGVTTLGGFIDLPEAGVHRRFGSTVAELHRHARNETWMPLDAAPPDEPICRSLGLDYAEKTLDRLLVPIDALLSELLVVLRARGESLSTLILTLNFERGGEQVERLRPGTPTLDAKRLLSLIRLRLESTIQKDGFADGIVDVALEVEGMPVKAGQLEMFRHSTRDLDAARDAFAQLRALFGDAAVVIARERAAHLPEARFTWEPVHELPKPEPRPVHMGPLVRRLFPKPIRLTSQSTGTDRHEPAGWLLAGIEDGPVDERIGPHVVSGGWWRRDVHREYHYMRTRTDRWLWTYHDRKRRTWFLQGEVE